MYCRVRGNFGMRSHGPEACDSRGFWNRVSAFIEIIPGFNGRVRNHTSNFDNHRHAQSLLISLGPLFYNYPHPPLPPEPFSLANAHEPLFNMSRNNSTLPNQIPILPLFDQAVLFPGLLLRLRITDATSTALLSHVLRSDQATLMNLVLGCIPFRPGTLISGLVGEMGTVRPALPALEGAKSENGEESKAPLPDAEYGCSARIKSLSRLDRSYGTTGFVLVVEGIVPYVSRVDG
jgi:hypothetical protein